MVRVNCANGSAVVLRGDDAVSEMSETDLAAVPPRGRLLVARSTRWPVLERKWAAILYADAVDYSRLSAADEEGTHRLLGEHLDTFAARIAAHGGEVCHFAGDAVLAVFISAEKALTCAVDVQAGIHRRNASRVPTRRVKFRIGINLGEVIVDRSDVYGNGVNIAARLQTLAEPGGICITAAVHDVVAGTGAPRYRNLGTQRLRGYHEPVHAYAVTL